MDRNRELRRGSMAAGNGGLRRRQQRSTNLIDSSEDGGTEMPETSRIRDRDRGSKKDRDRDRHRSSIRTGANPPPPTSSLSSSMQLQHQNQHVRKSFPVKKSRPPAPAWKVAEEMIGVSIPRKARSCVGSGELTHRHPSTSSARSNPSSNTAVSPPSPSNASIRKKQKQMSGSKQHRPPSSKISKSSPPSEIEIEAAEVLFGMTRQSLPSSSSSVPEAHQNLDPKEINILSGEAKSRISSPVSSSPPASVLPSNNNIAALVATAPKMKRPKFDEESPTSPSGKAETELPSKMGAPASVPASPLRSEKKVEAAYPAVENDTALADVGDHKPDLAEFESCNHSSEPKEVNQEITAATSKSKETPWSDLNVNLEESTSAKGVQAPVSDSPCREEKFGIDLMAPPSALSGNSERVGLSEYVADHIFLGPVKGMKLNTVNGGMEHNDALKSKAMETASVKGGSSGKSITNEVDIKKLDLQLDLEKQDKDTLSLICSSEHQQQVKQQCKAPKMDPKLEKSAHPVSLPSTMPIAGWHPHFGYIGQVPSLPAMQIVHMNSFWPPATAPLYGAKQYNLNVMPPSEAAVIIGNPLQGGFPGRNLGLLPDKASPSVAMTHPGPPPKEESSVAVAADSNNFMEVAQRKQFLPQQTPHQTGSSTAPPNMIRGNTSHRQSLTAAQKKRKHDYDQARYISRNRLKKPKRTEYTNAQLDTFGTRAIINTTLFQDVSESSTHKSLEVEQSEVSTSYGVNTPTQKARKRSSYIRKTSDLSLRVPIAAHPNSATATSSAPATGC